MSSHRYGTHANSVDGRDLRARISQDRDGTALGVARQLNDCRKEAARRGWTVAEEYIDDDVSTRAYSSHKRPRYEQMLADIADGTRDAVIVWHMDRLHRRPIELEERADTWSQAGLTEVVTLHGDLNLDNGDGLLVARLLAAVAANESDAKSRRSRRSRRKMQELAEAGRPHGGGTRPFRLPGRPGDPQPSRGEGHPRTHRTRACRGEPDVAVRVAGQVRGMDCYGWRTPT